MATKPLLNGPLHAVPVDEPDEMQLLRDELADLQERFDVLEKSYQADRDKLGNLLHTLRSIFGGDGAPVAASTATAPPSEAAWRMWKERLPGACPKVIDALLIQPLTATQLIAATKTSHSTVQRAINVLENNALIEKDGARIRLKRL